MSEHIASTLDEARAVVERGWTQGWFARNDKGNRCSALPTGRTATCYCMVGALIKVTGWDQFEIALTPEFKVLEQVVGDIPVWNDAPSRTQAEVIEAFRKAAELARAA